MVGIVGSHGVAIAPALVVGTSKVRFRRKRVPVGAQSREWERFVDAVCQVQSDLREKIDALAEGSVEGSILEAYLLMVGDETLARGVHQQVHDQRRCADWAVAVEIERLTAKLEGVDDVYIRERSHDIEFVGDLLLRALGGADRLSKLTINEPCVVVARDLSPADTAGMVGAPVKGFVTEVGSRTSHTAIMARALEIPAVIGVQDALMRIGSGDLLIVDALRGRIIVDPSPEQIEDAERRASRYAAMTRELGASRDKLAATSDGTRVILSANIELPEEASIACEHGAEGVGLYRTEFLYVNRVAPPNEEEQLAIFERVVKSMDGRPVTLRTFDIGGDKFATTFRLPGELNPMLGLRAVRLALTERDVFRAHLRAMLRASMHGPVKIMIPLVSSLDELRVCRELITAAREELVREGLDIPEVPLGVMIEVPAAAIMADAFAAEADFMSIGTNDLVQYALAIDRTNRALAHLASPYDPSILRLVAGVIRAGAERDRPVSVCGEMASEPYGALVLAGLGIRDLSMESVAIPEIKEVLGRVEIEELRDIAHRALGMSTAQQVEMMLEAELEPRLHDIITHEPMSSPGSSGSGPPSRPGRMNTPAFGLPKVTGSSPDEVDPVGEG
ncbi:MAG TPA: phosphoenolpyruvate--protein phosphotransferase [Polyangiaceae bacterium]|nr:phosphoenolpyruvate--protein phosphotransferase [Polyangiaceae bacterium]